MEDKKTKALKFTESPKVTFSGSSKEPSVLTSSLGFLPEHSDACVKSNTLGPQLLASAVFTVLFYPRISFPTFHSLNKYLLRTVIAQQILLLSSRPTTGLYMCLSYYRDSHLFMQQKAFCCVDIYLSFQYKCQYLLSATYD